MVYIVLFSVDSLDGFDASNLFLFGSDSLNGFDGLDDFYCFVNLNGFDGLDCFYLILIVYVGWME